MATKSFTDTYKIKRSDVKNFRNIMSDTRKFKIRKVKDHRDVIDEEEMKEIVGNNEYKSLEFDWGEPVGKEIW